MPDRRCAQCGTRLMLGAHPQATLCVGCFKRDYDERAAEWQADVITDPAERVKRAEDVAADLAASLRPNPKGDA